MNRIQKIPFVLCWSMLLIAGCSKSSRNYDATAEGELPVTKIPNIGNAAEAYFSPDGKKLICNAKREGDEGFQTYTLNLDGTDIRRINDRGEDACSYFYPSTDRLLYTSTRDNLDMAPGNWSDPENYPQGAELYSCDLHGNDVQRLTFNEYYDAEVSITTDEEWILFGRQIDGKMDLWRMRPDGSDEFQITHTPDWQEGGSFYMPDNETILFRAWKIADQGRRGLPMTIFTIKHDGTGLRQITQDPGTNWAPYPAPDGEHFAFVKVLPPHNYEIHMMNITTGEQTRLTYSDAFDGFPSISPDGKKLCFSSSRETPEGERWLTLYLMDISSLGI